MIDFHCHLDLFDDPQKLAADCEKAGIYVLSVTTTPKAWPKTAALGRGTRYIRTALGLHPELAHERFNEVSLFERLLDETRYVGEIGLDGSPAYRPHAEVQLRVFERILASAQDRGGRIYTIHSRGAADAVLASLQKHRCGSTAVLHWFSGSKSELKAAIALDCWFSVGPVMLRSDKGKALAAQMPRDRVLTETDGPFARSGKRPLTPVDSQVAVLELASLWSVTEEEAGLLIKQNLRELLVRVPGTP
ncbi:Qat anti-phage system TatD family nuclease QatD [Bradyrhizobium sp. HKCCYLS20291]|uniref:Qat anti-phage system TatD family nuclease QatD n=1 Tax=Bradyrhizobium sp. HKCCYLS20291 TaxID=3420766 RepID=UPI003EC0061F